MKRIIRSAPGRIGLVGNPFDIYGGNTIALTLPGLRSYVCLETNGLKHQDISSRIFKPGNNRKEQKQELEHAVIEELDVQNHYFSLLDVSDMPYQSGLARSTAAVVSMIRAFNEMFNLGINDNKQIAELTWKIERKLGVCGGQERYAIAHDDTELSLPDLELRVEDREERNIKEINSTNPGPLWYMKFTDREDHRFNGNNYAHIEKFSLPNGFKIAVVYATKRGTSSFSYHEKLREAFLNDETAKKVITQYTKLSIELTDAAFQEFRKNKPSQSIIGQYMSDSLNLRFLMFNELKNTLGFDYKEMSSEFLKMKNIAEENGALGIKQPGSKSMVFLYEDNSAINALKNNGFHTIEVKKD